MHPDDAQVATRVPRAQVQDASVPLPAALIDEDPLIGPTRPTIFSMPMSPIAYAALLESHGLPAGDALDGYVGDTSMGHVNEDSINGPIESFEAGADDRTPRSDPPADSDEDDMLAELGGQRYCSRSGRPGSGRASPL